MNRHERRAARKRERSVMSVDYGRLLPRDQNYGLPVACYLCGTRHAASGVATIHDARATTHVLLCNACLATDENGVARKYWNAPDLKIHEGGTATTEQIAALIDKPHTPEH